VIGLVLTRSAVLVALGLASGIAGAIMLTRTLRGVLYGVDARDPATFGAMAFLMVVVALAACLLPAQRAARVDPAVTLRTE
jgi:ABC-type lipoprotein release transport system permease subunit